MNWNPGVHVFIVGSVNTGSFTSFETAGIAFPQSGTRPGYALLAGTSRENASASAGKQTLMHEVGHVLGLRHDAHENGSIIDDIGLMQENKLAAGSGSCARMQAEGPKLLQPASSSF